MIYVGLGLPILNLVLSLIGSLGSSSSSGGDADLSADAVADADIDLDIELDTGEVDFAPGDVELPAPDMEVGDIGDADLDIAGTATTTPTGGGFVLRFNVYCLCLAFVIWGAVGVYSIASFEGTLRLAMIAAGLALAFLGYFLVYRFIVYPLKRNQAAALSKNSLRFRHVRVAFPITRENPGKIETQDAVGAHITYLAMLDPDICNEDRLEEGDEVIITDFDETKIICYVTTAQRKILDRGRF